MGKHGQEWADEVKTYGGCASHHECHEETFSVNALPDKWHGLRLAAGHAIMMACQSMARNLSGLLSELR